MEREGTTVAPGHAAHHTVHKGGGTEVSEAAQELLDAGPTKTVGPTDPRLKLELGELRQYAQDLLREAGVGPNEAAVGAALPVTTLDPGTIPEAGTRHQTIHTKRELLEVINELQKVRADTQATRDVLRNFAKKYQDR
jgi:hypothetical protein